MSCRAVVTGAGSGIGRALAVEIAKRGGRVLCSDIDEGAAKETAELVDGLLVACDVADADQVRALRETAERELGGVDLVVNNAGIGAGGSNVGDVPLVDWRRVLDVNLWGVVHGCHEFVPLLRETRGGVINVASAASFAAAPRMGPYNVSKAGVLALSETLAAELSGTGVTVTVLCPTFVRTGILGSGLVSESTVPLAESLMRWTGWEPARIAGRTLDAHDRGDLHVVPQIDARLIWAVKRLAPAPYTRATGLLDRLAGALGGPR